MSTNKIAPGAAERKLVTASEGVRIALPQTQTFIIDGEPHTVAAIEQKLGEYTLKHAQVRDLRAQLREAIAERKKIADDARIFLNHLKAAVVPFLGEESALLEKFGWKPRKERDNQARTPEAKPGPLSTQQEGKPAA
ncbi:MAG: hypothetical protein ACAI25_20915 [Planctomycetota bacterium]